MQGDKTDEALGERLRAAATISLIALELMYEYPYSSQEALQEHPQSKGKMAAAATSAAMANGDSNNRKRWWGPSVDV